MISSYDNSQRVSQIKAVRLGIDTKGDSERWDAGTGHTPQPRDKEVPPRNQGCSARLEVSWKATATGVLQLLGCQQQVCFQSNFLISSSCVCKVPGQVLKGRASWSVGEAGCASDDRQHTCLLSFNKNVESCRGCWEAPARSTGGQDKLVPAASALGFRSWLAGPGGEMRGRLHPRERDLRMQRLRDRQKHSTARKWAVLFGATRREGAGRSKADKGVEPVRSGLQGLGGTDAQGTFRLLRHSRCHLLFSHLRLYLPHPLHTRLGQTPTPRA